MKRLNYLSSLLCAVAMVGCTNEDIVESGTVPAGQGSGVTLIATAGADTRTTIEGLQVKWSSTDKFYAYGTKDSHTVSGEMEYKEAGTGNTATFEGTLTNDGTADDLTNALYAMYGYEKGDDGTPSSVTLPATYTYPESNAPMFGTYKTATDGGEKKMVFDQLLCGMLRLKVSNITETVSSGSLVLKAKGTNDAICGVSKFNSNDVSLGTPTASESITDVTTITLSFGNEAVKDKTITLDIPVYAADATTGTTYADGFHATLTINDAKVEFDTEKSFTMKAGELRTMKALNIVSIGAETIEYTEKVTSWADVQNAIDGGTKNISFDATIIPTSDATINIPTDATTDVTYTITVSGNTDNNLTISGGNNSTTLVINAPGVTVSTSGTFKTVDSTTKKNTLIVLANANIASLIARKGGIEVQEKATVNAITVPANAEVSKITIAAGTSASVEEKTDEEGNVVTVTTVTVGSATITITVPKEKAGEVTEGSGTTTDNKTTVTIGSGESAQEISPKIELGDIMLKDGSIVKASTFTADENNPAIGVVACLYGENNDRANKYEADGSTLKITAKGLVLALEDVTDTYQWASADGAVYGVGGHLGDISTGNIQDYQLIGNAVNYGSDGYRPTQIIYNRIADTDNSSVSFPAFEAIQKVTAPANTTGWYMPSIGEWRDIIGLLGLGKLDTSSGVDVVNYDAAGYRYSDSGTYNSVATNINDALTKAGTTGVLLPASGNKYYWSSTESAHNSVWVMVFGSAGIYFYWDNHAPDQGNYVRCVLAF